MRRLPQHQLAAGGNQPAAVVDRRVHLGRGSYRQVDHRRTHAGAAVDIALRRQLFINADYCVPRDIEVLRERSGGRQGMSRR
jgi:hypothetical protein